MDANGNWPMDRARLASCDAPVHKSGTCQALCRFPRTPNLEPRTQGGIVPQPVRRIGAVLWRGFRVASVVLAATMLLAGLLRAEPAPSDKKDDEQVETKQIAGQVSAINSRFIAVEYARDSEKGGILEMAFPIDGKATFEHVRSASGIKMGDTVKVEYKETSATDEHGQYTSVQRVATKIALVRTAPSDALSRRE